MDPDDLAALNRLLGGMAPTADPPEHTMGQLLAHALTQFGPGRPVGRPPPSSGSVGAAALDPGPTPQEFAAALQARGRPAAGGAATYPAPGQGPAPVQLLASSAGGNPAASATGGASNPGAQPRSKLIGDSDQVLGDALNVVRGLNSKWMYGGFDTKTAQSDFDQTNAAIDRTVAALQSSKDPEAQAAIERLNNAGYQLATQARQAGLQNTDTESIKRAMQDMATDAGKDAIGSAFGEEFGH